MKLPFPRTWWIEPGKVFGGRYPGTQDPEKSQQMLDKLLALGVRTIINLQTEDERGRGGSRFPDYRPVVAELAKQRDITVACHRFPIPDLGVPTREMMTKIQGTIRRTVDAGQLVYVHCWGGHGRTGTVAGCWLVGEGLTPQQAFAIMEQRRAHDPHLAADSAPQTEEQRRMIEHWKPMVPHL